MAQQQVIHDRPDTVVVHEDHDNYDDRPANNTGLILGIIAIVIVLLILFFGIRSFGGSGSGTTNINVPKPTVNVPSSTH